MIKKILDFGFKGLGIGFVITNIMMYFSTLNPSEEYTVQGIVMIYIVWSIASVLSGGVTAIYKVSHLALLYKTLIHVFCIALIVFGTISYMMNNIYNLELNMLTEFFPSFIIIFLGIYLILWVIYYLVEKRRLRRINEKFM